MIGAAPEVLNTINELAAALGNDGNYATTIQNQIHSTQGDGACYLKDEVDTKLGLNASTSDVHSKVESNSSIIAFETALALKAATTNVHSKVESNASNLTFTITLHNKADKSNSYVRTEVDTMVALKEDKCKVESPPEKGIILSNGTFVLRMDSSYCDALIIVNDFSNVYSKDEINDYNTVYATALNAKAVKTEVDTALALKVSTTGVYSRDEINTSNTAYTTALNTRAVKKR